MRRSGQERRVGASGAVSRARAASQRDFDARKHRIIVGGWSTPPGPYNKGGARTGLGRGVGLRGAPPVDAAPEIL